MLTAERPAEEVANSVTEAALAGGLWHADATAIVIDVLKLPEASFDEMAAAFSQLRCAERHGMARTGRLHPRPHALPEPL